MSRQITRIAWLSLSTWCLILSGCMVPYAFPHLSCVPGVQLTAIQPDLRAFRVDVTGQVIDRGESEDCLLSPVTVSPAGATFPQASLSLDYGCYVIGIALNYPIHHGHSTLLRLYCPGYQLAEVRPSAWACKIRLTPAPTIPDQEKAIDDLLGPPSNEVISALHPKSKPSGQVKPGSCSRQHREALLFAAAEYQRLAALVCPDDKDANQLRERLTKKAMDVTARANQ